MIDLKAIRSAADTAANKYQWVDIDPGTVITLLDRLEAAEKDAARLKWLLTYFASDDTSKDDEIIAASEVGVDQIKLLIDAAMEDLK